MDKTKDILAEMKSAWLEHEADMDEKYSDIIDQIREACSEDNGPLLKELIEFVQDNKDFEEYASALIEDELNELISELIIPENKINCFQILQDKFPDVTNFSNIEVIKEEHHRVISFDKGKIEDYEAPISKYQVVDGKISLALDSEELKDICDVTHDVEWDYRSADWWFTADKGGFEVNLFQETNLDDVESYGWEKSKRHISWED